MLFYRQPAADPALITQHVTEAVLPALRHYAQACKTVEWNKAALSAAMKQTLADFSLKMPQLAMPLRLLLTGQLQTPSIDAVIELFGREVVLQRLAVIAA
jgi:glutamyl-tRNA synthetase